MIRMYSKRLLSPYIGVIQVVELEWARALSLDGKNWAVRYAHQETSETDAEPFRYDPRVNCSLLVTIEAERPRARPLRPFQEPERVRADSQRLFEIITAARLPFAAADHYEYWLLDCHDGSPLALLHSCTDEADMERSVPQPLWLSMPAAELAVPDPSPPPQTTYLPPVNYRLQQSVEERAGSKPRAAWFRRAESESEAFPPCLLSEQWDDPESRRICELYLQRLAPRLLMMDGLSREVRQRLELAAREHVFEVEKFYALYPEVVDESLLNAARVEARLRHANDV